MLGKVSDFLIKRVDKQMALKSTFGGTYTCVYSDGVLITKIKICFGVKKCKQFFWGIINALVQNLESAVNTGSVGEI